MSLVNVKLLERYRIDRTAGRTVDGSTELVVLVLKGKGVPDAAYALSKADAMAIALQLQQAAVEASETMGRKLD